MTSKGGTGRAYLSEPGIRPLSKHKGCYCVPWPSEALDELARILSETEPENFNPYAGPVARDHGDARDAYTFAVLAESLAAVTADGGPLDQLAASGPCKLVRYHGEGSSVAYVVDTTAPEDEQPAVLATFSVILAAQRDLDVLSAYAQAVRA